MSSPSNDLGIGNGAGLTSSYLLENLPDENDPYLSWTDRRRIRNLRERAEKEEERRWKLWEEDERKRVKMEEKMIEKEWKEYYK